MTDNTPAIVPHSLGDDQLLAVAEHAEKRIEAVKRIKTLALKVTNSYDWTDQGGKPYLQVSGSEKIARLFGISWRLEEPRLETEEDGHFHYTYRGIFSMGSAEIEAIGTRSSKDAFFSRSRGQNIPVSDIDRGDVKKAAYTNCLGNGITRLLGLRNMSWSDLELAGIKKGDVGKVEYRQGGQTTQQTQPIVIKGGKFKGKALGDLNNTELAEAKQGTTSEWLKREIDKELAGRPKQQPGSLLASDTEWNSHQSLQMDAQEAE